MNESHAPWSKNTGLSWSAARHVPQPRVRRSVREDRPVAEVGLSRAGGRSQHADRGHDREQLSLDRHRTTWKLRFRAADLFPAASTALTTARYLPGFSALRLIRPLN